VSNWQIWLVAAIVSASSRSCSGQAAPATANHKPNTGPGSRQGDDGDAHDIRQRSSRQPAP
jgi:hypothetical protein